jgi:Cdc6-like AAA superfamily ATPase
MMPAQRVRRRGVVANKYNPFRPDKMIPPGMFCGRLDELQFIDHCLLQTKNGNPQHFLIEGERGIGKSSLFLVEQSVAEGRIPTFSSQEKLDFIVISISLLETDDYYSIIRKIMVSFKIELAKRHVFKAFASSTWDLVTRIEAGGIRFNRGDGKPEESELLGCLQADFVKAASSLAGVADGILLLIDEADKPPVDGNLGPDL